GGQQEILPDVAEPFVFDPNGFPVSDWERLGLTEKQIRMIRNYEAKGGRFRKKEDFAKIYAISSADYARLAPYIRIRETTPVNGKRNAPSGRTAPEILAPAQLKPDAVPSDAPLRIELNTTDSLALLALPGIGPVYAS